MTPAANPSMASKTQRFTSLVKKTSPAPSAVIPHVNAVAINTCTTGGKPVIASTILDHLQRTAGTIGA
jgi:hypothetical protein